MKVETFECQETIEETVEMTEEAIGIIEACGLEGQQELLTPLDAGGPQARCPYREIKKEEAFVYNIICPRAVSLESFGSSPIPLRVLQIISHAKSLGIFKKFMIWCAEGEIKDPVLVAYDDAETWRASTKCFILARWADELDAWPQLVKKAIGIWKRKTKVALQGIKAKVAADLTQLTSEEISLDTAMSKESIAYYGLS